MPEGDTIHLAALRLRRALEGKAVESLQIAGHDDRPWSKVSRVEARGKNLLLTLVAADDSIWVLHTHMMMTGSWHLYRPEDRWRKPRHQARVVLQAPGVTAVCFNAPLIELMPERAAQRDPQLSALGPDLLGETFDELAALPRFRQYDDRPLGEVIMLQHVVAGVGNIWKSETLFACGYDPFAPVGRFDDAELRAVMRTARDSLRRSVARSTRAYGESYQPWVYRRSGQPCRRCGAIILRERQGEAGRSTYYCPRCQPRRTPP